MTFSAPKPAHQFHEPEPSEAEQFEPESSWPADGADDPETHLDRWHELPCDVGTAPCDSEQQRMQDVQASLHEQLAMLVRALESEGEQYPEAGDDDRGAEPGRTDVAEAGPPRMGATEDEPRDWSSGLVSLAALRNVLNGRARGFMVGFGASIAVAGIVLVLAGGDGDLPAIASVDAPSGPRIIAAFEANGSAEQPLRASMLGEIEQSPTTVAGESRVVGSETSAGDGEAAADFTVAVPGTLIEPVAVPEPANEPVTTARPAPEAVADAAERGRGDDLRGEPSAEVAMTFETTVQPAPEAKAKPEEIWPSTQSLASRSQVSQTAHVVKHVNMRAGPDNAEAVLAIIPKGSPVEVVQCELWCEVISEGQRGWVYKDLITGVIGG